MKRLGKVNICGIPFQVFEGTSAERDALGDSYGYCDHERQELWIREGMKAAVVNDTVLHEILHGLFTSSGAENYIGTITEHRKEDVVENLIQILTPHLRTALSSLKGLQ